MSFVDTQASLHNSNYYYLFENVERENLNIAADVYHHADDVDRPSLSLSLTPVPFIDTVNKAIAVPNRGRIIDATAPLPRSIESTRSNEPYAFSGRDYRRG